MSRPKNIQPKITESLDTDWGSVGRVVASYTRCLQFESSHRQSFVMNIHLTVENTNEDNRGQRWSLFKRFFCKVRKPLIGPSPNANPSKIVF